MERYVDEKFDLNRCRLTFKVDGETLLDQEFVRDEEEKFFKFAYERTWTAGDHELVFELKPIAPDREQNRLLRIRLASVTVQGPLEEKYWTKPKNYAHFFPRDVPRTAKSRRVYARELLEKFASRAFRRPVDAATADRLMALAESVYSKPDNSFETGRGAGHGRCAGVTAIYLPRGGRPEPVATTGQIYAEVDEYSLASRLSYFFWSSMPDEELFNAGRHWKTPRQSARADETDVR